MELASRRFRFTQGGTTALACALGVMWVSALAALPFTIATYVSVRVSRSTAAVRENSRLSSVVRLPVFSLFNDGLRGHSTLRAFGREANLIERFDRANHLQAEHRHAQLEPGILAGYALDHRSRGFNVLPDSSAVLAGAAALDS